MIFLMILNLVSFLVIMFGIQIFDYFYIILIFKAFNLAVSYIYRKFSLSTLICFMIFWTLIIEIPSIFICIENPENKAFQVAYVAFLGTITALYFLIPINYVIFAKLYLSKLYDPILNQKPSLNWYFTILIASISIFTAIYYLIKLPQIPILSALSGNSNIVSLREDSLKNLDVPDIFKYFIAWSRDLFFPYIFAISIITWKYLNKIQKLLLGITILIGLFFIAATTEKAPVSIFFMCGFMAFYVYNRYKFHIGRYWVFIPILASFPLLIYALSIQNLSLSNEDFFASVFENFFNRTFLVPARVGMIHFEVFPDLLPFLNGSSITGLNTLLNKDFFNLPNYLYIYHNPYIGGTTSSGYANATFVSEMWANFGVLGCIAAFIIVGFLFNLLDLLYLSRDRSVEKIAIYSCAMISTFGLLNTNVTVFFTTKGFGLSLLFITLLNIPFSLEHFKLKSRKYE